MGAWDFEAAYAANARMVYWAAYGVVKNESDAMDVSQETFLRALRHEEKLAAMDEGGQRAWLYRVAVNLCYDKKRREKRELVSDEEVFFEQGDTDEAVLPEMQALRAEEKALLRRAVEALPEPYRQTVLLHYYSELPYETIASLMGTSEGTVKSRMSRAKQRLYDILRKEGGKHA